MRNKIINILSMKSSIKEELIIDESDLKEDICLDSLDKVEACMELEEEFSINIIDEAMDKFVTVGDIIKYVENAVKEWKT